MTPEPVRVVMVEDDPWVARVNRALVEAEPGFVVVAQAETVRQGLELTRALSPDLLLVDVYLPDGSGLELVQQLRAGSCHSEVILITAASDLASVQGALHGGALDYLIKPFQQHRLREALGRYRARASAAGERNFTQGRLDRLLGHQGEGRLPKGLDPLTLEGVEGAIGSARQPLSAEEVASRVGLSRVSAWRYLEYLCEQGALIAEMAYGSVGRPTKRYKPR